MQHSESTCKTCKTCFPSFAVHCYTILYVRAMKDHIVERNARIYECDYKGLDFNSELLRLQFQDTRTRTRTHKRISKTSCSRLVYRVCCIASRLVGLIYQPLNFYLYNIQWAWGGGGGLCFLVEIHRHWVCAVICTVMLDHYIST